MLVIISTHTLTWSVTKVREALRLQTDISTHTLTWSVTLASISNGKAVRHFNSHAHVERDYDLAELAGAEYDFNSYAHVERDRQTMHSRL